MSTPNLPPIVNQFLPKLLGLAANQEPFPWQLALCERLVRGEVVRSLDIPTGLGKTSVMALWLVARVAGAPLPRRLVYVVDRRAVVDQATTVAEKLRECVKDAPDLKTALGLERDLPISTLRGRFVDNREWLEDPTSPAIVVGTVDMIGSRLLFEGYGVSRKMRPYHAGLLGADTLLVLDEAHLVPPFEKLLETIANGRSIFGPIESTTGGIVPDFRLMSLSATGRQSKGETFTLSAEDKAPGTITRKRLDSIKKVTVVKLTKDEDLASALAQHAWSLAQSALNPIRCLIFANSRDNADKAREEVLRLARGNKRADVAEVMIDTELFVGGRRVFERENSATRLEQLGFVAGIKGESRRHTFLFATSAGEVGVDLDADHLVCDVVEWERMVQRLGRVNRRGEGAAQVRVLWSPPGEKRDPEGTQTKRLENVLELISRLPTYDDKTANASPGVLANLKQDPSADALMATSSTPAPLHPPLTRALIESWSMTSLEEHSGRPEVAPWIRGWVEAEDPKTNVVWREILPVDSEGALLDAKHCETFFEAANPHLAELLELESFSVVKWLRMRLQAVQKRLTEPGNSTVAIQKHDVLAVVRKPNGRCTPISASFKEDDKRNRLDELVEGALLLVDIRLGGLAVGDNGQTVGLLDEASDFASDVTVIQQPEQPRVPFRVRRVRADNLANSPNSNWREEVKIPIRQSESGDEVEWLMIESWASTSAGTEEARAVSAKREQTLAEHQQWTAREATRLSSRLNLPSELAQVLTIAARLHDEGKKAPRWQRAFGKPGAGEPYAKTKKRPNVALLGGYRHELGSLPFVEANSEVEKLPPDYRDLCLHMVAAHHGRARPLIPIDGADAPPSILEKRSQEVALRFARLEKQWGPWGLAWWEALLRAADQKASRDNDEGSADHG